MFFINVPLFLACIFCIFMLHRVHQVPDQYEYVRWQGESEEPYSQISCFMPSDGKLTVSDIFTFRNDMMKKFEEASIENGETKFIDCWSTEGSVKAKGDRKEGSVGVTAVGGSFFAFHPMQLVSGNYIFESDLMKDNVLLDEEAAWMLFGGSNLAGMSVDISGIPFRIAGVVSRDDSRAFRKAYTAGPGIFMSYDAFSDLSTGAADAATIEPGAEKAAVGISCYELCLPNPVKNFALGFVESKFPIGSGEIVENSGRYDIINLLRIAKNPALRVMHGAATYPSWENAARYVENKSTTLLCLAILFGLGPELLVLASVVKNLLWTKLQLEGHYLPALWEKTEEAIRVQERKQWEKKHPNQH